MLHQTFLPQAARCPQEAPMSARFQLGARVSVEDPNRRKCRQQNPQTYFPETAWFLQGAPMSACSQQKRKWKQSRPQKSFSHRAPSPLNVSSIKKCHVFFHFSSRGTPCCLVARGSAQACSVPTRTSCAYLFATGNNFTCLFPPVSTYVCLFSTATKSPVQSKEAVPMEHRRFGWFLLYTKFWHETLDGTVW